MRAERGGSGLAAGAETLASGPRRDADRQVEDFTSAARDHPLIDIPPADAKLAFEHPFGYQPRMLSALEAG